MNNCLKDSIFTLIIKSFIKYVPKLLTRCRALKKGNLLVVLLVITFALTAISCGKNYKQKSTPRVKKTASVHIKMKGSIKKGERLFYNGRIDIPACINCHDGAASTQKRHYKIKYSPYAVTTYNRMLRILRSRKIKSNAKNNQDDYNIMMDVLKNLTLADKRNLSKFYAFKLLKLKKGYPP